MTWLPVLLLMGGGVGIGITMATRLLRGLARRPMLIGLHILCGAGALEELVVTLHGTESVTALPTANGGSLTALMLAGTLFIGFSVPLISRRAPGAARRVLVVHAVAGLATLGTLLVWLGRQGLLRF